jgi:hypothetical protein
MSSPLGKNISVFQKGKSVVHDLPSRPERGALAIVTNVGTGSGGRGSARAQVWSQGGFYRPVSDREGAQTNGTEADGKIVWS